MNNSVSGLALLVGGLVAGCSIVESLPPGDTITLEEAEQRTEDYARQALDLLPAHARAEVDVNENDGGGCGGLTHEMKANATIRHQIHGLRVSEYPKYFHKLEHWWFGHGFDDQIEDDRPTRESILAYQDGYRMRIHHEEGELLLITISPCVWPDGHPE